MQELPVEPEQEEGGEERTGRRRRKRDLPRRENHADSPGSYYYDDAYGYEDYIPEEDEDPGGVEEEEI